MSTRSRWQPPEKLPTPWNLDAAALAIAPWTVLIQGHGFGLGNHDFLLCSIRRMIDPSYLVNDWMLSTPASHPQLLGLLSAPCSWWGEPIIFLLVHLLTRVLLLMGVWRLADALLPGRWWVALLSMVATLLEPRFHIGSHYLQGGHWEPAFLGMAFAVWTLASAIRYREGRGSWITLTLSAGFGIFAHLFIGLPVFVIVMAGLLYRRTGPAKELLWIVLIALFLGSPAWIPAARGFFLPEDSPLTSQQVIQVLQFRHPHHHQPWTWPLADYVQVVLLLAAGVYAWWNILEGADRRRLLIPGALLAWFLASCVAFTVFGRLQVVAIVAYLQPFRLLSLFILLSQIALLGALERVAGPRRRLAFLAGGIVALTVLRLNGWWGGGLTALNLAALAWQARQEPLLDPEIGPKPRLVYHLVTLCGLAGIGLLQFHAPLRALANRVHREHWLVAVEPQDTGRAQLADWIHRYTNPNDVFAIPPNMGYFRLWEQRAVVVDMKNMPYRNVDLKEWAERVSLGGNGTPFTPFAVPPTDDPPPYQLVVLAQTYKARYVLIRGKIDDPHDKYPGPGYSVIDLNEIELEALQ
jgi:hypothetical protein